MRRTRERHIRTAVAAMLLLAVAAVGCSTKSPTAPTQDPGPGGPPPPSAVWTITVEMDPAELVAGTDTPATVTVRVRRADNGNAPPSGTTIVITTTLGDFESLNSGLRSLVLALVRGRAEVLLFPGTVVGNALISAQLESSVGQKSVPIVAQIEEIVAAFNFANTQDNLSVQFQDASSGSPTEWRWDFGDGGKSSLQNPSHIFPASGDFVVTLTASKTGSSDTISQIVTIDEEFEADFEVTVENLTAVFLNTSTGDPTSFRWDFGDGRTSTVEHPRHTYSRAGTFVVTLRASKKGTSSEVSKSVTVGDAGSLFITSISPSSGPPGGGTSVTITGQNFSAPARVLFGGKLGTVTSVTSTTIKVLTPPFDLPTEDCDSDDDGNVDGKRTLDVSVDVEVELSNGASETVNNGFTYDADNSCVPG